jgi:hypothetical protein
MQRTDDRTDESSTQVAAVPVCDTPAQLHTVSRAGTLQPHAVKMQASWQVQACKLTVTRREDNHRVNRNKSSADACTEK